VRRIVPDLPGLQCDSVDAEVEWWEPMHEVLFRLLAGPELAGITVRGAVRIWCGPLIAGEVSIAIPVATAVPTEEARPKAESGSSTARFPVLLSPGPRGCGELH